jgi:hypothetical protein
MKTSKVAFGNESEREGEYTATATKAARTTWQAWSRGMAIQQRMFCSETEGRGRGACARASENEWPRVAPAPKPPRF